VGLNPGIPAALPDPGSPRSPARPRLLEGPHAAGSPAAQLGACSCVATCYSSTTSRPDYVYGNVTRLGAGGGKEILACECRLRKPQALVFLRVINGKEPEKFVLYDILYMYKIKKFFSQKGSFVKLGEYIKWDVKTNFLRLDADAEAFQLRLSSPCDANDEGATSARHGPPPQTQCQHLQGLMGSQPFFPSVHAPFLSFLQWIPLQHGSMAASVPTAELSQGWQGRISRASPMLGAPLSWSHSLREAPGPAGGHKLYDEANFSLL